MKQFDLPVKFFRTDIEWGKWLAKNYHKPDGVWLKFFKKASGVKSLNYDEALDEALCYGWIDGLVNKFDDKSYVQRFTPRRARSIWSVRNKQHVARLIKAGRMKKSGFDAIAAAKKNGQWAAAYHSPSKMEMPKDFLAVVKNNKKAQKFFATLNKVNTYAIAWRLNTTRNPEIRKKKILDIVKMLATKKKFHYK